MLDDSHFESDAASQERILRDGGPDWDLDVVARPRAALLFALGVDCQTVPEEKVFKSGPPREATFRFRSPAYPSKSTEVFRAGAYGLSAVQHTAKDGVVDIRDRVSQPALYVVAGQAGECEQVESRRQSLITKEASLAFDPGKKGVGGAVWRRLLDPSAK